MRQWISATLLAIGLAVGGQDWASPAAAQERATIKFTRLMEKLPVGTEWATLQGGAFCSTQQKLTSDGVSKPVSSQQYEPIFTREFAQLGYSTSSDKPNLFDTADANDADYQIGGLVHGMDLRVCRQTVSPTALLIPIPLAMGRSGTKGTGYLEVQWQVFSIRSREVVATVETSGSFELKERRGEDAIDAILAGAFAENVKALGKSPQLKAVLNAPLPAARSGGPNGGKFTRITAPAGKPMTRPLGEAVGAVVLVSLPDGSSGSGVLVSTEGYLLTNEHVVGKARTVKIRWSDGFETDGEVIRTHEARDVALVKTDPRERTPLPIRSGAMQIGDSVTAIGSPLGKSLQGTVTRGIVSANRIMDGYSFIQSDVAITHGNSGGPLLNEKGEVVGLSDAIIAPEGAQIGLNLFIPIRDALDFLSLDVVAEPFAQADIIAPTPQNSR